MKQRRITLFTATAVFWTGGCLPDDQLDLRSLLDLLAVNSLPDAVTMEQPVLPNNPVTCAGLVPYVRNDNKYTSWIAFTNRSTWWAKLRVKYYDLAGKLVDTEERYIKPQACDPCTRPGFCGTIEYTAWGESQCVKASLEMRRNDKTGVALAQSASLVDPWGPCWYYEFNVTDLGPGKTRTVLATHNCRSDIPIYVEYGLSAKPCGPSFEVKIPPRGVHAFCPFDKFGSVYSSKLQDVDIYVSAHTGPNRTGQPVTEFTGARLIEEPNGGLALLSYKYPLETSWDSVYHYEHQEYIYLLDVQDNGTTRYDQIHVKCDGPAGLWWHTCDVYFYDNQGNLVKPAKTWTNNTPQFKIAESFDDPGSSVVLSPQALLGKPFVGTVVIDAPHNLNARVLHRGGNGWVDLCDEAPGRQCPTCFPGRTGFVSNLDPDWRYALQIFLPVEMCPTPTVGSNAPPAEQYGSPTQNPPQPGNGRVILRFYDVDGTDRGWLALQLGVHETRRIGFDNIASKYLGNHFEGWVSVTPALPARFVVESRNAKGFGSCGIWRAADY